jgi:hypothetical protein
MKRLADHAKRTVGGSTLIVALSRSLGYPDPVAGGQ